uniref:RNB domain-containing protein n=1 Tax=Enterobius vermicularis TaxID=51028 RepID=A0A0N4V7R2_ENTVE
MRTTYQPDNGQPDNGARRFLSIDEYAMLSKIRSQSQRNTHAVRTGRVSVDEVMGFQKLYDVQTFLENLRNHSRSGKRTWMPSLNCSPFADNFGANDTFSSSNNTDVSRKRLPLPSFPTELYSVEIPAAGQYSDLKNVISDVGSTERNSLTQGGKLAHSNTYGRGRLADESHGTELIPGDHFRPSNYDSDTVHLTTNRNTLKKGEIGTMPRTMPSVRNSQLNGKRITDKKLYFSEYMSVEAATRGVAKGQLYKGTLHVNGRSFEESFLINASGDLQEDLLIFGLHDRNRALHGDVVIVRVKDRENWLVRDALFCAWRESHLKTSIDEDGRPVTVPPIRSLAEEEEMMDSLNLPFSYDKRDLLQKSKKMFVPPIGKFTREQMLLILAKLANKNLMQLVIDNSRCFGTEVGSMLRGDVLQKLVDLCIIKPQCTSPKSVDSVSSSPSSNRSVNGSQHSGTKLVLHRRYYFLRDLPDEYWGMPNICLQRTAEVVCIIEHKNSRAAVGMLKVMADGNRKWALFSPNDSRMPRMMIPAEETPAGFFDRPHDFTKFIYVARMVHSPPTAQFARGRSSRCLSLSRMNSSDDLKNCSVKLYKSLGVAGDISAETEGLLLANAVDTRSFPASVLGSLQIVQEENWKIDEKEFKYRRDFREDDVFSVRMRKNAALENAFHVKRIEDFDGKGTAGFEIGVHVVDVAYFVNPATELDQWAAFRATSVTLVTDVIQMLPPVLVEGICSLSVGSDRLCLSVVWIMDEDAVVHSEWFGRSVVCLKKEVSVEQAQSRRNLSLDTLNEDLQKTLVDSRSVTNLHQNSLRTDIIAEQFVNTTSETIPSEDEDTVILGKSLCFLKKLATCLREKRYENGSMQLQKADIAFHMNDSSGLPSAVTVHHTTVNITSITLEMVCEELLFEVADETTKAKFGSFVEEILRFANASVAKEIQKVFGGTALLRRQCPPKTKMLDEMLEKIRRIGVDLHTCTEEAIESCLRDYDGDDENKSILLRVCYAYPKVAGELSAPTIGKESTGLEVIPGSLSPLFVMDANVESHFITWRAVGKGVMKKDGIDFNSFQRLFVISYFLSKPMQLPEYYCAGSVKEKSDYVHFSLALPLYTHFTSPLNRYADIVVQRFLSAAVGQTPPPRISVKEVANLATHCNDREHIARSVYEANEDMFFGLYVKEHGPLTERAVVVQILDAAFDVLVVEYGIVARVYANKLRVVREPRLTEGTLPALTLYWDSHENTNASVEQIIQLCSVVEVVISSLADSIRYQVLFLKGFYEAAGGRRQGTFFTRWDLIVKHVSGGVINGVVWEKFIIKVFSHYYSVVPFSSGSKFCALSALLLQSAKRYSRTWVAQRRTKDVLTVGVRVVVRNGTGIARGREHGSCNHPTPSAGQAELV